MKRCENFDVDNILHGTMRKNGVLGPMTPYGCHSDLSPDKFTQAVVYHGSGEGQGWLHRMSMSCRYDRKLSDARCNKCTHDYDIPYVNGLTGEKNG